MAYSSEIMERYSVWRKQHTRRRKLLTLLVVIATFIIMATVLSIIVKGNNKADICLTSKCIEAASKTLQLMDSSADPCEDFFQFACGGYINEANIPHGKHRVSTRYENNDLIMEQLRALFEEPLQLNEFKPAALVKKLYKSCMNKDLIQKTGLKEIQEILTNVGGWPVLEGRKWNEKDFDWKRSTYELKNRGLKYNYLIGLSVEIDNENSSRRIIYLDRPYMSPGHYILSKGPSDKYVKAYYDYMVDIAVIFGADEVTAREELWSVLLFHTLLANISESSKDGNDRGTIYKHITIQQLQLEHPTIPWLEYINTSLFPHAAVTNKEFVVVNYPTYLTKFEKLIDQTPKRIQANYIMWQTVMMYIEYLPYKFTIRKYQYDAALSSDVSVLPRWRDCISSCYLSLNIAASALYARKYFNEYARQDVQTLISNIRSQLKDSLREMHWMDWKTKENALEKVDAMKAHVGYAIELLDDPKLEEYYQSLELDENRFLKSILNISAFDESKSFEKLHLPVNKSEWTQLHRVITSYPYYLPYENTLMLPAGILQNIFFSHGRPNYMNYGSIGFEIGHQMVEGIAGHGRLHNKQGNLVNWWMPEANEILGKKSHCFIKYYDNYTVPEIGLNLNSTRAQYENIADIGGLKQAYLAYDRWVKRNGDEPTLPGLNYTGRQLFWISAANTWCSRDDSIHLSFRYNSRYLPNKYKVLGAFSNQNEFAKDFGCKPNSKMNPINKCQLW